MKTENPNKSAVACFGTVRRLQCTTLPSAITLTGSGIQISDSLQILGVTHLLWIVHSLWIHTLITLLRTVITICKHFDIFVHPLPRKLRILWPVLLLVHDSITVTLCSTKCLTKTSTNCSKFRIVQHELFVESVDGNKMLGSTGYLFTLGRILNWQLCVLNHMSCDNRIIWQ